MLFLLVRIQLKLNGGILVEKEKKKLLNYASVDACDTTRVAKVFARYGENAYRDNDDQRIDMDERVLSHIQIRLSDEKIAASLWLNLESLYMIEPLTNDLYLKHCLFNRGNLD